MLLFILDKYSEWNVSLLFLHIIMYIDRKQVSVCLMGGKETEMRKRDRLQMSIRNLLGMMDMPIILILAMVSWVDTYLKTY